jgi:hypothetical protein
MNIVNVFLLIGIVEMILIFVYLTQSSSWIKQIFNKFGILNHYPIIEHNKSLMDRVSV